MTDEPVFKRWALTVDWCSKGLRGLFCSRKGEAFFQDTPHTEQQFWEILDAFALVLDPKSVEMTAEEVRELTLWIPLGEFREMFGYAVSKKQKEEYDATHKIVSSDVPGDQVV